MISLLFVIIGHFSYGITNTLWYNPRNAIGTLPLIMVRSFFCCIIFLVSHFVLSYFHFFVVKSFNFQDVLFAIIISAINYFGLFFYLQSLKYTQVSNVIGFSKIGLIIGVLIGYFFYDEQISNLKIICAILILIGISIIEITTNSKREVFSKGLIFSFFSRLFWSTSLLFIPYINALGVLLFCTVLEAVVFTMSLVLYVFSKKEVFQKTSISIKREIIFLILLGTIGTFSLNFAIISSESIIVFAFLGIIEPFVGLIISNLYHKEKLNKYQFLGIFIGLFASFILSTIK